MLQPHSLFWHYLWLGPHVLQIALAIYLWRRGLHKAFPVFFTYLIFEAVEEFTLYAMDLLPSVSVRTWWIAFSVSLVVEGLIRIGVIGELFFHLLRPRPALAKVGSSLLSCIGALLVLLAAAAAAYVPIGNPLSAIGSRAYVLQQTLYLIECGLILFLFLFCSSFRLRWDRATFGIALGRGISSAVHLSTWGFLTNGGLVESRYLLDFLNMATYHLCVLIWFYYLLVPRKSVVKFEVPLPENHLDSWNRELERLLQQ
jgi:hypothetical protein